MVEGILFALVYVKLTAESLMKQLQEHIETLNEMGNLINQVSVHFEDYIYVCTLDDINEFYRIR